VTDKLPGILQEIADLVGEGNAIALASRHGGTRVYFPTSEKLHEAHWLWQLMPFDDARKLCDHFSVDGRGQRFEIPLYVGGTYRQFVRAIAERVHKLDQDDASSTEIVRKVGVTQRTVHRHRARHRGKKDGKQGRLL
jgi:hypothetical protein